MKLELRNDKVMIEGYVNAIERNSRPLMSRIGQFLERICKGAFKRALERAENVEILLNHDNNRLLGSTKQGNLELYEDNIGLHARAEITDAEVIQKARQGDLIGWSFGFTDIDVDETMENGNRIREVKDLNLYEVSIIDRRKLPAYEGTLVEVRANDEIIFRGEEREAEVTVIDNTVEEVVDNVIEEIKAEPKQQEIVENNTPLEVQEEVDYSTYENAINSMKGD
jgi:HK97 family phage prohead protease